MTHSTSTVFLSYKHDDETRVAAVAAALEGEGFSVWWDRTLQGGTSYREQIEAQLATAGCVVVFWSHTSVGPSGDFVRDEARRARERGVLLPVLLEDVDPPLGFGELQAIDLRHWRGRPRDPFYRDLVAAIRARLEGTPLPPAAGPIAQHRQRWITRRRVLTGAGAGLVVAAVGGYFGWRTYQCEKLTSRYGTFVPPMRATLQLAEGLLLTWRALETTSLLERDAHRAIADAQKLYWEEYRKLSNRWSEHRTQQVSVDDPAMALQLNAAVDAFERLHENGLQPFDAVGQRINMLETRGQHGLEVTSADFINETRVIRDLLSADLVTAEVALRRAARALQEYQLRTPNVCL